MAEKNELAVQEEIPSFLQVPDEELTSLNEMISQFVRPPRMKIVQPQAKSPLIDNYKVGDVVLMPSMTLLAEKGALFEFTPLFFYPEWMTFNPLGAETTVADRTIDPHHEIAMKSRDPKLRVEESKDGKISHREHLNFICQLRNHSDLEGVAFVMVFAKAEHKTGMSLASMIKMRRIPYFGTTWVAKSSQRTNSKGNWFGLDIKYNGVITDQDEYESYKALNAEFKVNYDKNLIVVDADDDEGVEAATEF